MSLAFDKKTFIYLSLAFILFTVVGTLSHELGHYVTARILGYKASIGYNSTTTLTEKYNTSTDSLLITARGPFQTLLFGSIGVLIVSFNHKKYKLQQRLNTVRWLWIFLSLFWLREIFNFLLAVSPFLITSNYPTNGDEIRLALLLGMPTFSISFITGFLGSIVFCLVIYFIPYQQRFTFLCSLIFGGLAGYLIWMKLLGPVILPG